MAETAATKKSTRRRGSSSSTVKASTVLDHSSSQGPPIKQSFSIISATVWVHDHAFSSEDVLINESILGGSNIEEGNLIEVTAVQDNIASRDFQPASNVDTDRGLRGDATGPGLSIEEASRWLCLARFMTPELKSKKVNLQISVKSHIATAFGFRQGSQVMIRAAAMVDSTASHVEFSFRDTYLARSDMWRLVGQELSGKTVYTGQKITFLGSIRLTVKAIHVNGHKASAAFFSGWTLPIFRSEAARYIIFVQMSREMWDFDSEGNGEILFNRVINGFLPELFKRWSELEVRHLVSIVLFGRQEYRRFDFAPRRETSAGLALPTSTSQEGQFQDFYRVVVTDMASAQWTTILDELKKDFRVFLRDISLHPPPGSDEHDLTKNQEDPKRITGQPSLAMKGNILEAIDMAATQFSNDYVDRDLIRTGVSVVVITAGTGVFEVDRDLLNLTSQNLTNNGIGIDIVCLSKMPLHSVPLFKYRPKTAPERDLLDSASGTSSPYVRPRLHGLSVVQSQTGSPALSSLTSGGFHPWSRYSVSTRAESSALWCYGIPHWIDLSYWVPETARSRVEVADGDDAPPKRKARKGPFVPRVRMYEVQMMGLMELGMADISIPWLGETPSYKPSRRHRKASNVHEWSGSRSLSQSPNLSRHSAKASLSSYQNHALATNENGNTLSVKLSKMHNYDETLFKQPLRSTFMSPLKRSNRTIKSSPEVSTKASKMVQIPKPVNISTVPEEPKIEAAHSPTSSILSNLLTQKRSPEALRANRTTSYALRGLAPPMRAVASTEINVEHVQAQMPKATPFKSRPTMALTSDSLRSLSAAGNAGQPQRLPASQSSFPSSTDQPSDVERPSTPIRIQHANGGLGADTSGGTPSRQVPSHNGEHSENMVSHSGSSDESSESDEGMGFDDFGSLGSSIPKSNVPFIRNVNASNPLKGRVNREAFFGRWQHLYPRKPRASTVKWRSLCTPASVPLTTEDFPSKDVLESEFDLTSYTISLDGATEQLENPESRDELFREMLSLRFAHGYQLVVGPRMNRFEGPNMGDPSFFFNPDARRTDGHFSFLSMGSTIQKLALAKKNRIVVTRFVRKHHEVQPAFAETIEYFPHVRTILSEQYRQRSMRMKGFTEAYPWETADRYLSSSKKHLDHEVEVLRFWRARFVLLPVEPPSTASRPTPTDSVENEEEIHLRGIRALTQQWQKMRYIPPDERRPAQTRPSNMRNKDRNPLRINMETLNPSELVATELDKLLTAEEAGDIQTAQLLPEEEQFERESAALSKLAAALQGERGIEIKNRRWHLRLYYSCFLGEDFTNWLVQNFKDLDPKNERNEAIELGNDLMKEGLFEHVNGRHNFKDGNFFYSIKAEYRVPRPELKQTGNPPSRKSDKSIPLTPATEQPSRDSPLSARSRSGSNLAAALSSHPSSHSETTKVADEKPSKRLAVSLSKVIRLDVDVRHRSNRPEIVNLHYDRLHNPENCYHLELSWFNVTSKLVDDAIVSWTTQAERYGLKLVEVPIAEMSKVPDHEPFRAPHGIKLACKPPKQPTNGNIGNGNAYFIATSFTPVQPPNSDIHLYQKHLLKRFNFVLDLEAVSEFPENVEINYSWGRLEYQYTQFVHRSGVILAQITHEGDILLLANRLYNSRLASTKDSTAKFDKKDSLHPNQSLRPPALGPSINPQHTQMQASGILGLNVQSPTPMSVPQPQPPPLTLTGAALSVAVGGATPSPHPKPVDRISADVLGSKRALGTSGLLTYVTPEQIKDDLEDFCSNAEKLEAFYAEVTELLQAPPPVPAGVGPQNHQPDKTMGDRVKRSATGTGMGTSSSLLRPVKESDVELEDDGLGIGMGIPEFQLPEAVTGRRTRTT